MIRILHISDLHIAATSTRVRIEKVIGTLQKKSWLSSDKWLHFAYCDKAKLETLAVSIAKLEPAPDIICVSGDLTTFGDEASFKEVSEFLRRILLSAKRESAKLVVVPGNHDTFEYSWTQLESRMRAAPFLIRCALRAAFRDTLKELRNFPRPESPLHRYGVLIDDLRIAQNVTTVNDSASGLKVVLYPLRTVSLDPLWMNRGDLADAEWARLKGDIPLATAPNEIRIVAMHHNPLSSPKVREGQLIAAYNGTVGATAMLSELQNRGVDIVLCGHQHAEAAYSIDFQTERGPVTLLHAPAATVSDEISSAGYNVIDVKSRHEVEVRLHTYKTGEYTPTSKRIVFVNQDPVTDHLTKVVHAELRNYRFLGNAADQEYVKACNEMIANSTYDVIVVGQTLRGFSRAQTLRDIVLKRLQKSENAVRILIMDPEVTGREAEGIVEPKSLMNSLRTGYKEEAQASLARLRKFKQDVVEDHGQEIARRLMIGIVPAVVPFGVNLHTCLNDENYKNGEMFLEILPVGSWRDEAKARLHIEERSAGALYSFYNQFVRRLIEVTKWE